MKNKSQNEGLAVKINPDLYAKLRDLSIQEGKKIKYLLDKSVENYLRAKKVLPLVCQTKG